MVAVAEGDPAVVVATLRQALEALSRLSADRAALEEALKVPPLRLRRSLRGAGASRDTLMTDATASRRCVDAPVSQLLSIAPSVPIDPSDRIGQSVSQRVYALVVRGS